MPMIAIAADGFVTPDLFRSALEREIDGAATTFRAITLDWPQEPFGEVGDVLEASGTIEETIDAVAGAHIALTQMAPFTAEVFDASPDLRMVGVCRGGPVNVDLQAATDAGVLVTFAPGRNAQAAAEFAVGLTLSAMRRIPFTNSELKNGAWRGDHYAWENVGVELHGATVGLVGYGAIGRIVARILKAFGADIIVYDPYTDSATLASDGVEAVDGLDELLSRSAVVSLHARLTPETERMIDERALNLLPRGAVLVNTARGGLLDYAPLPGLLQSGRLGAVALDVYDVEPPPGDWPLFVEPNAVVTPHLAGATRQTAMRAADIVARDVARFLDDRTPLHVANPAVLTTLNLVPTS
ncbi:2-hydroxyacid dehydrogenase [Microbacterium sp. ET2]|uniref:2-hydroxyacid dehydrogenase n=1 Tax=Microbacterium albipurpureum TaxID=3050384 RepID=UPI00259CA0E3|nr:2-hydroxyacid dehydrogenase [Microbacterium sp. ET2 (Ac-2212)]WJL96992.1 2-hydroxyacid dehydrogenase [Microbacterium sp. ET2 (Ac-2212)]